MKYVIIFFERMRLRMKKLLISNIDNYIYYLVDEQNIEYKLQLEFYDINNFPKIGDYLYISQKLLNEQILLSFVLINNQDGKDINLLKDEEILVWVGNCDKIYFKRYYG